MRLSWSDALKVYWPYVVMFVFTAIGSIYTAGYASGQRSMLFAAQQSALEVKHG